MISKAGHADVNYDPDAGHLSIRINGLPTDPKVSRGQKFAFAVLAAHDTLEDWVNYSQKGPALPLGSLIDSLRKQMKVHVEVQGK